MVVEAMEEVMVAKVDSGMVTMVDLAVENTVDRGDLEVAMNRADLVVATDRADLVVNRVDSEVDLVKVDSGSKAVSAAATAREDSGASQVDSGANQVDTEVNQDLVGNRVDSAKADTAVTTKVVTEELAKFTVEDTRNMDIKHIL